MSADDAGGVTIEVALDTDRWDAEIGWTSTVLGILSAPAAEVAAAEDV